MKKYLLLLVMILGSLAMSAQTPPVKWRSTVKMTSPAEGVLTIRAIVTPGYHIYGTKLDAQGPVPTTFDFKASTGIKFLEDFHPSVKPTTYKDKAFSTTVTMWNTNVTFTRRFKIVKGAKPIAMGTIRYMACDDNTCTPPRTESVKVVIPQ